MDDNKSKALTAAVGQIEKQFGKGAIMRLGDNQAMDIESISTGSLSIDIALGIGGLPCGRVVEIYGPESSGKTTLTLQDKWRYWPGREISQGWWDDKSRDFKAEVNIRGV